MSRWWTRPRLHRHDGRTRAGRPPAAGHDPRRAHVDRERRGDRARHAARRHRRPRTRGGAADGGGRIGHRRRLHRRSLRVAARRNAPGPGAHVGTFVETKNADIGEGAKVPHLSYMGDVEIGPRANVGAGTITANYDGKHKHPSKIGADARIGSNTVLVAPVEVGDGAYTGAGSVVNRGYRRARSHAVFRPGGRRVGGRATLGTTPRTPTSRATGRGTDGARIDQDAAAVLGLREPRARGGDLRESSACRSAMSS